MSAQKDRLIQAAELLDLDPAELLTMLDQRTEAARAEVVALHLPTDVPEYVHRPFPGCDGGPSCPWHESRAHADEGIATPEDDES